MEYTFLQYQDGMMTLRHAIEYLIVHNIGWRHADAIRTLRSAHSHAARAAVDCIIPEAIDRHQKSLIR